MEQAQIGLLLAKIEANYGVDAAPTAAANNIAFARGLLPVEPQGTNIPRPIMDAGFGIVAGVNAMPFNQFKLRCELRGNRTDGAAADISAGASANAIPIDVLLRACDFAPTYVAESSGGARDGYVIYQPTIPANEGESLTIYAYAHKKRYIGLGCKGTIDAINLEAGKFGFIDFTFQGRWVDPADAAIPANPVFVSTKPPLWQKKQYLSAVAVTVDATTNIIALAGANTSLNNWDRVKLGGSGAPGSTTFGTWYYAREVSGTGFKIASTPGGAAIDITTAGSAVTVTSAPGLLFGSWDGSVTSKLNLAPGQSLQPRPDACIENGIRGFQITGRDGGGDFDPESVSEATNPFWADWKAGNTKEITVAVGDAGAGSSGNRYSIIVGTQPVSMGYEDRSGRRIQNVRFAIRNSTLGETPGSELRMLFS